MSYESQTPFVQIRDSSPDLRDTTHTAGLAKQSPAECVPEQVDSGSIALVESLQHALLPHCLRVKVNEISRLKDGAG